MRPQELITKALVVTATIFLFVTPNIKAQETTNKPRLILDADTGNEIDDLYAIIRMVRQNKFDLLGLTSAQWRHHLGEKDSVQASQRLNEELVKLLGRTDLPTPIGAELPFGKPWGGQEPQDSPAAQFIIKSAKETPAGEKLIVVCIGASTNLASAIKMAPEIAPRINGYLLAFQYDWDKSVWNKSEFNVRRDLDAADFLLNQPELELHIMPTSVSKNLVFKQDRSFANQAKMGALGQFLTDRWQARFPNFETWIMWDITTIEALIFPEWAEEELVTTPPENIQRKVWMYKTIEQEKMQSDFWKTAIGNGE